MPEQLGLIGKSMPDGTELQPNEIERIACSGRGGLLRLETSIRQGSGYPYYDIMRCICCGLVQGIADDRASDTDV
jgi:hypothetical protein